MKRYEPTLQWRQGHGQMTDFCKPTVMASLGDEEY